MSTTIKVSSEQMRVLTEALHSAQDVAHEKWASAIRNADGAAGPADAQQYRAAAAWHRQVGHDIRGLAMSIEDQRLSQEQT